MLLCLYRASDLEFRIQPTLEHSHNTQPAQPVCHPKTMVFMSLWKRKLSPFFFAQFIEYTNTMLIQNSYKNLLLGKKWMSTCVRFGKNQGLWSQNRVNMSPCDCGVFQLLKKWLYTCSVTLPQLPLLVVLLATLWLFLACSKLCRVRSKTQDSQ